MILADKLVELRKKNGWSQEDFAEQMGVSRQSVSKWEGAQAIPDMNKLIRISEIYGVTLDYLMKDSLEQPEITEAREDSGTTLRKVSLEDARRFLDLKKQYAPRSALGVALCILSPVPLLLLGGWSEMPHSPITENMAAGLGVVILLLMVAAAVSIFIFTGSKVSPYTYLEREIIETAYGVDGMVKEEKEAFRDTYLRNNIIGVVLCICSAIPLMVGNMFAGENEMFMACMVCCLLLTVAAGVYLMVLGGIRWGSIQQLLQEGDYTPEKKKASRIPRVVSGIYWVLATALFLLICGLTGRWNYAGVFWSVAGLSFVPVILITNLLCQKKEA